MILVTGGAGFIGSHTAEALLDGGYGVRIVDTLDPKIHPAGKPAYLSGGIPFLEADVRSRETWEEALEGVSAVFHFAAYQDYLTDFSTFYHVNAVGTSLMYETIVTKGLPVEKVVVASSQAVYGEGAYRCGAHGTVHPSPRPRGKLDESNAAPANSYAISKYTQETLSLNLGRQYGIPTTALRYSIVQGPRQSFYNAYSGACRVFCLSAHFGEKAIVFEDGGQKRDYVNIEDVVRANLLVLRDRRSDGEVYNVGGGRAYTVLEFLSIVRQVSGKDIDFEIGGSYRCGDTRHIISDIEKLGGLGFVPEHTPEKSVRDYLDWLETEGEGSGILTGAYDRMKSSHVVCQVV
jgi:dTDP-L-rhamnose 4-epimerase